MNYSSMNNLFISKKTPLKYSRSKLLFRYLIQNGIAFSCSKSNKNPNKIERQIIKKGIWYQRRFYKTLELISKIAKDTKITPILIKTIKWLGEVVDGDIDLIVARNDFGPFISAFEQLGFYITFENSNKAICTKEGYCKIEPRTVVEYSGDVLLEYSQVKSVSVIKIQGKIRFHTSPPQLDNLMTYLNCIHGPKYLRLYDCMQIAKYGMYNVVKIHQPFWDDIMYFDRILKVGEIGKQRYPILIPIAAYTLWWFNRILPLSNLSIREKTKKILFLIYLTFIYNFTSKLVFQHEWI